MKKKVIIAIVTVLTIVGLVSAYIIYGFVKEVDNYTNIIKINWGINLPKETKELYSKDSGPSFHGDGDRYHIFQYADKNNIDSLMDWHTEKNESLEVSLEQTFNQLKVPKEQQPNLKNSYKYYWKTKDDSSKAYFVYISDSETLYVLEHFQ